MTRLQYTVSRRRAIYTLSQLLAEWRQLMEFGVERLQRSLAMQAPPAVQTASIQLATLELGRLYGRAHLCYDRLQDELVLLRGQVS